MLASPDRKRSALQEDDAAEQYRYSPVDDDWPDGPRKIGSAVKRTMLIAGLFGALALAGAAFATPTHAATAEALPAGVAQQLDKQDAEFTMTAAKRRRLMMIESTNRQQHYANRGHARGYGARPGYGYGRSYGHRPGYGPRPGYGYRRY